MAWSLRSDYFLLAKISFFYSSPTKEVWGRTLYPIGNGSNSLGPKVLEQRYSAWSAHCCPSTNASLVAHDKVSTETEYKRFKTFIAI